MDIKEVKYRLSCELDDRMVEQNISLARLAMSCRIMKHNMYSILEGKNLPNLWTLSLLAERLDCTANDLLGFEGIRDIQNLEDICAFDTFKDEDSFAVHLRDRIIARMKELNIDREELTNLSGLSRQSIERCLWICPHLPQLMKFLDICEALDCTPSDLLGY